VSSASTKETPEANVEETGERRSFRSLTGRQRVLLFLILLAVPLLLLLVTEGVLRVAGYGSGYPLFIGVEAAPDYRVVNPDIGHRYFIHAGGMPRPMADLFRAEKAPGTFRLVVQGGSTTAGFPYGHGGAFTRMLEDRLQATFPEREIEVINVALDATNSYTLLDLAPDILAVDPDAVAIYAGHNEYYGVLGVASAESVGRAPVLVHAYLALRRLRTVQALQNLVEWSAATARQLLNRPLPPRRTLMEYLASEHTVPHGSARYYAGLRQLERNLDRLLALYRDAGIPVYIGTLASNERDQPPFISRTAPETDSVSWAESVRRADALIEEGDSTAAGAAFRTLTRQDSIAADPHYRLGRLLDAAGDTAAALAAYLAAIDRDQLPFRAPTEVNRILTDAARRHGATLVPTREALASASPGGIVGETLMLEHLHPNVDGQFLLADAFYDALRGAGAIGDWSAAVPEAAARARIPVTAVDTLAGRYTIDRLTSGFPFRPAGADDAGAEPATPRPRDRPEAIARAYHAGRLSWTQALEGLEEHYAGEGRWRDVAHVNRVLAQEIAYAPAPLVDAAQAELLAGRDEAALEDVQAAERRWPTARSAWIAGNAYARQGDTARARLEYQRAQGLDRRDRRAGAALAALGSIPELERRTRDEPGAADAGAELAAAYFATGRYERARTTAEGVLRDHPEHPLATQVVRQVRAIYRSGNE
jgi:tetratricopeptide (TPR) repeat protein